MSIALLRRVILRDLSAVRREIGAYENAGDIWACPPGITNSAGTLALHLAGNLQHFVGGVLGGSGYVRDRDAEFADRDVPVAELLAGLDRATDALRAAFDRIEERAWDEEYPLEMNGLRLPTGLTLLHLASHLSYHLGQIDYHRRIVCSSSDSVGAVSIPRLVD